MKAPSLSSSLRFLALGTVCLSTLAACGMPVSAPPIGGGMPTPAPTMMPTPMPTGMPSAEPTAMPTAMPTGMPTAEPTAMPSMSPTPMPTAMPSMTPGPRQVFALQNNNVIQRFSSNTPGTQDSTLTVTGLTDNDVLVGIDFRPANGQLFGLGSGSRIYSIDTTTGAATAIGNEPLDPLVNGSSIGFDFNPTVDRIRVHTNLRQNLRVDPNTGMIAMVDGELTYSESDSNAGGTPNLVAAAYTNNMASATTTQLFALDASRDTLVSLDANAGVITTVGNLGINIEDAAGFDITSDGMAYVAVKEASKTGSSFYQINLSNGMVTLVADIASAEPVIGLAIN
ncbi:MAG: DUF4394 domain-containing protein [Candidatus Sericytochromatia bacterium]